MLILHIGCPRTGTTSLQKNLFKLGKETLFISKKSYGSSGNLNPNAVGKLDNTFPNPKQHSQSEEQEKEELFKQIFFCALKLSVDARRVHISEKLIQITNKLLLKAGSRQLVISSERFSDCSASLVGNSKHDENGDKVFAVYSILKALNDYKKPGIVTVCMRSPIQYLRSKYLRTSIERRQRKIRLISPKEFIQKQATLETSHLGTSALMPAIHSEFIKQLQQHAFVKAFGFQELLATDDVFSLMGLQGEEKYAFRDFPRENRLPFTKGQEQEIEIEITQALKQYGFYDRIMKAQMFE